MTLELALRFANFIFSNNLFGFLFIKCFFYFRYTIHLSIQINLRDSQTLRYSFNFKYYLKLALMAPKQLFLKFRSKMVFLILPYSVQSIE